MWLILVEKQFWTCPYNNGNEAFKWYFPPHRYIVLLEFIIGYDDHWSMIEDWGMDE